MTEQNSQVKPDESMRQQLHLLEGHAGAIDNSGQSHSVDRSPDGIGRLPKSGGSCDYLSQARFNQLVN